jgi:predicted DNA-binding protein
MTRVNTRISAEINDWLDEQSRKTGVTKSTLIHMALENYMTQKKSVNMMEMTTQTFQELFLKIDNLEKRILNK